MSPSAVLCASECIIEEQLVYQMIFFSYTILRILNTQIGYSVFTICVSYDYYTRLSVSADALYRFISNTLYACVQLQHKYIENVCDYVRVNQFAHVTHTRTTILLTPVIQ